ncbi:MAG TPA: hypothetical protein VNK04_11205 [Gemmataceae bacterium]|nr:hypothetical protein [Gemmataceae bacterium]
MRTKRLPLLSLFLLPLWIASIPAAGIGAEPTGASNTGWLLPGPSGPPGPQFPFFWNIAEGGPEPPVETGLPWVPRRPEDPWTARMAELREPPRHDEAPKSLGWQIEEALPLPVPGRLFLFTQVGAGGGAEPAREVKLTGRTGLGWKLPLRPGTEVQLRSGPALSCSDPLRPESALGGSQLLVEMQCRWRLLEWAGLEYQGTAVPALHAAEQGRLDQDLGIVFPLGKAGQFRVGTKHTWAGTAEAQPWWRENLQLQVGSTLRW